MAETFKITVTDQGGNIKKELTAEGFVICAFSDEREFAEGVMLKANSTVVADNVATAEVAAVMMHEETPLGQARKMLNEMAQKQKRLSKLFGKLGRKE